MTRVIVVCSAATERAKVHRVLDDLHLECGIRTVVTPSLPHFVSAADEWAHKHRVPNTRYPVSYMAHGKLADTVCNQRMIAESSSDLVIVFPDAPGARDLVRRARGARIEVLEL